MPARTKRERLSRLRRFCSEDTRDLACQVVIKETGARGPIYGGRWHTPARRYLQPGELDVQRRLARTPEEWHRAQLKVEPLIVSAKQASLIEDLVTPMIMANGSRRGGKSRGSAGKAVVHSVVYPGRRGELISPTFPKSDILWRYIRRMMPTSWISNIEKRDRRFTLHNGTVVQFLSAHHPDSLIGEGVGWIGFDEFQSIGEEAVDLAMPALSDAGTAMQLWGAGTPRMGWYRSLYERFRVAEEKRRARILHFTYRDNPFLETGDGTVFDLARDIMDPRRQAQELDALFESEEGLVYYRFNRSVHHRSWGEYCAMPAHRRDAVALDITQQYCAAELETDANFIIGVDYGLNKQFAVIFKVVKAGGQICLWAIDEVMLHPHHVNPSMRAGDVKRLAYELVQRDYYPAAVFDDPTGPKGESDWHLRDARGGHGEPLFEVFHFRRSKPVMSRVNAVNSGFGTERTPCRLFVDCERCPDLVYALENQEIVNGKPERTPPAQRTKHDPPDAFGYPVRFLMPAEVDFESLEQKKAA